MNGPRSYPGYYDSARDYALDHLDPHDPRSPAELTEEYGCVGDHMRKTLAELVDSGEVERVSRGQYVLSGDEASTDSRDDMGTSDDDTTLPDPDTASTAELYQRQHAEPHEDEDREISGDDAGTEDADEETSVESEDVEAAGAGPVAVLPVHPYKLGAALVILAALWLVLRDSGMSDPSSQSGSDTEQETGDAADGDGGLLG